MSDEDAPPQDLTSSDPFVVLGIRREASKREVKRAYVRLIKKYRPDSHPNEFTQIHKAYSFATSLASSTRPNRLPSTFPSRPPAKTETGREEPVSESVPPEVETPLQATAEARYEFFKLVGEAKTPAAVESAKRIVAELDGTIEEAADRFAAFACLAAVWEDRTWAESVRKKLEPGPESNWGSVVVAFDELAATKPREHTPLARELLELSRLYPLVQDAPAVRSLLRGLHAQCHENPETLIEALDEAQEHVPFSMLLLIEEMSYAWDGYREDEFAELPHDGFSRVTETLMEMGKGTYWWVAIPFMLTVPLLMNVVRSSGVTWSWILVYLAAFFGPGVVLSRLSFQRSRAKMRKAVMRAVVSLNVPYVFILRHLQGLKDPYALNFFLHRLAADTSLNAFSLIHTESRRAWEERDEQRSTSNPGEGLPPEASWVIDDEDMRTVMDEKSEFVRHLDWIKIMRGASFFIAFPMLIAVLSQLRGGWRWLGLLGIVLFLIWAWRTTTRHFYRRDIRPIALRLAQTTGRTTEAISEHLANAPSPRCFMQFAPLIPKDDAFRAKLDQAAQSFWRSADSTSEPRLPHDVSQDAN